MTMIATLSSLHEAMRPSSLKRSTRPNVTLLSITAQTTIEPHTRGRTTMNMPNEKLSARLCKKRGEHESKVKLTCCVCSVKRSMVLHHSSLQCTLKLRGAENLLVLVYDDGTMWNASRWKRWKKEFVNGYQLIEEYRNEIERKVSWHLLSCNGKHLPSPKLVQPAPQ
jgi:hypothetical protein